MAKYVELPDGNLFPVREGESLDAAMEEAYRLHPQAFGVATEEKLPAKGSKIKDLATEFGQSALGSTKALTDIFGADNVASKFLESKAKSLGEGLSPERRAELAAQQERMRQAEATGSMAEELKAGLQNVAEAPVSALAQATGSLVPYALTSVVGTAARFLKLAPATVQTLEGLLSVKNVATAQGVGAVKGSIYDAVYQKELEASNNPDLAARKAELAQNYLSKNIDQIVVGGGLGRLAGSAGAERLLTKAGMAEASQAMVPRIAKAGVQEFLTEAPQGAQERLAANLASQRAGFDVPTMQGVVGQGVQEGLMGVIGAAPVAALRGPGRGLPEAGAPAGAEVPETPAAPEPTLALPYTPQDIEEPPVAKAVKAKREMDILKAKQAEMEGFEKPGKIAQPTPEMTYEEYADYLNQLRLVKQQRQDLATQAQGVTDLNMIQRLARQDSQLQKAQGELEKLTAKEPVNTAKLYETQKRLLKELDTAKENGDLAAQSRIAKRLADMGMTSATLEPQPEQLSFDMDLTPKGVSGEETRARYYKPGAPEAEAEEAAFLAEQPAPNAWDAYRAELRRRQEEATGKEVADMEARRLETSATEQGDLFGETETKAVTGGRKEERPSEAQTVAALRIARLTGNREQASNLAETLRDIRQEKQKPERVTTPEMAEEMGAGRTAIRANMQAQAADARAKAFADIVDVISKYNRGLAKPEALQDARNRLIENMANDVEATTGKPMSDTDRAQMERDANRLLNELVARFGDTRNLSMKGGRKQPLFVFQQTKGGEFTKGEVPGTGFPTVESAIPGMRTFANPFAASMSIKEGLDELRNKAVGTEQGPTFTRTLTQPTTTPNMLLAELDQAFAQGEAAFDPDTRKTLLQVADNLNAISADPDRRSVVADWAYRTRIGQDTTERTQEVKNILRDLEEGKRSETETLPSGEVRRAQQMEIKTGKERGKVFATPAEFEKYLASDALQQLRSDMNISGPTLSRLVARLKPFQNRAAKLREEGELYVEEWNRLYALRRKQLNELSTLSQQELAAQTKEIQAAEKIVADAKARLFAMETRLDEEVRALDIAYQDAALKFEFAVKTSEDITKAIQANITDFDSNVTKAMDELADAKEDLSRYVKSSHPMERKPVRGTEKIDKIMAELESRLPTADVGVLFLQNRVIEATRSLQLAMNATNTDKRILDFLQKDLSLQMQLADEAAQMDTAATTMINAQMALYEAKQKQQDDKANRQELKEINEEIDLANEMLGQEKAKQQELKDTVSEIERDLGFETQTINHRISEVQATIAVSRKRATQAEAEMSDLSGPLLDQARAMDNTATRAYNAFIARREAAIRGREETTAEKQTRDNEQRRLENEMLERMVAMPGERISFETRRQLIERSGTSEEAIGELMDAAEEAQETLDRMKEADLKLASKIDDLNKQIAKLEKQTATEPRTFKGQLEKRSRLVELGGLREQRDAMLKTREQLAKGIPAIEASIAEVDDQIPKLLVKKDYIDNVVLSNEAEVQNATLDRLEKTITKAADGMKRLQVRLANMVPPGEKTSKEAKEKYMKLRKSRQNDLSRYKREYNNAVAERDAIRGVERTQLPVEPLPTEPVVAGTRLGARVKGPVAKKAVQAGNVRTGELTTTGERKLSSRNKPVQTGQKKRLTTAQVMKAVNEDVSFEQAMLASDEMETRITRFSAARDAALAAGNTEQANELDRRLDSMNKVLEKLQAKAAKGIKAPTKVLSAEDYENFPEFYEGLGTTYRETNVTEASPVVKDFLRKGNLEAALRQLVKGAQTGLLREHAQKVLPYIKDTKVVIRPNLTLRGESVPAYYDPATNTIFFDPRGMSEENVVHEAVHAATKVIWETPDSQLTASQRQAKAEINAMYKAAVENTALKGEYGLKNAEEFMSEMQSNERFRAAVDKKPWLSRFFSALARLLGFSPKETQTARASRLIEQLYSPSKAFAAEAVGAAPTAKPATKLEQFAADMIAQPQTLRQRVGNNPALEIEMQGVDMRAALRDVLKHGDDKLFKQAMYNVRKADQKMPQVYTVLNNGPLELYKDDKGFIGVRSSNKNPGKDVFEAIASIPLASGKAKVDVATAYLVAQRAVSKSGQIDTQRLLGVDEAEVRAVLAEVDRNPALKKALENVREKYNAYNKGMIDFNVATGAMTKAQGEELTKAGDYVPYYRVTENGMAELVYGDNTIISVGDIRSQPYLAQLKGGAQKILPLNESLYQNTLLLTDKALTNLATRNVAYGMQALGEGKGPVNKETGKPRNTMPIHKGAGPADPSVIRFSQEPDPNDPQDDGRRWLKVDTKGTVAEGIPAELVVKSLEGAHLPLPAFLKMAGAFTDVLRSGVTRMPPYILRQLIRDPMAATFTGGLNYGPLTAVLKAGTEFLKQSTGRSETAAKLLEKGLIQSNIFTGDADDMSKIALQIASGKDQAAYEKLFAALDRYALRADAATRVLVYENALKNGLSEVEADMMTMESMNFYKRGLNPAVQYANRLIPFINAQIQGLNVLAKAFRGNMPFEEQLKIKQKFYNRAMFLFATGLVYALAMDDDDTFKNARPRDKYSNFFLHLPGTEEAFKIPIPFEAGYFYSVAVALADAMKKETNTQEQWEAVRDLFLNSIPGWSSRGVPQIVKPAFEVFTNKNFMSGAPIESARMEGKNIAERFNANTTEFAKGLSKAIPILSPVQIEHLARAYLGVAPLAAMGTMDSFLRSEKAGEAPERRLSETPVIGSLFQKQYGGADADVMYRMSKEAMEAKETFNAMRKAGRMDDAREFLESHRAEITSASAAGSYRQAVGRLNTDADRIRNRADLSGAEKRQRLDEIDAKKQELANRFMSRFQAISERTTPQ